MFRDAEVPQGPIDGTNRVFTLVGEPYPKESLLLVLNGLAQRQGVDYTLDGKVITYVYAPQVGDYHLAWYRTRPGREPGAPGISKSDALALISARLGSRTGLDQYITQELVLAQIALESNEPLPWFLVNAASLVTAPGADLVVLPEDFLREYAESGHTSSLTVQVDGGWRPLRKVGLHTLQERLPASGLPLYYAVVGDKVRLHPTPDQAYSLALTYYSRDARLDEVDKNAWLSYAPEVLVAYAGLQVARYLRDTAAAQMFREDLTAAMGRLAQQTIARAVVSTDPRIGGFEDEP